MYKFILINIFACLVIQLNAQQKNTIHPVDFNQVKLTDEFWLPRLETQMDELVPFAMEKVQPAVENLRRAGAVLKGDSSRLPFAHRYISSDLYKVLEGAAYLLKIKPNAELEKQMDQIIEVIAKAQKEDGYLYVAHNGGVAHDHAAWGDGGMGDKPYTWVVHSHELYNMGHMYEGAIAYYQATGKRKWLDVAEKNAQHINKVFFEGDSAYNNGQPVMQAPGHQELELALIKLSKATRKKLYAEMARKFLDIRGVSYQPQGTGCMNPEYAQQHLPVKEQEKVTGHAVRAAYMYTAMADVNRVSDSTPYKEALAKIWEDMVDTRMHITGGLGAIHGIEGFGPEYELPNKNAYNETCAAVGNVLFNYRMFLAEKDARYIDVAEVALYNNVLAGVNLEGNKFFYVNPLEADGIKPFNHGNAGRSQWFGTACCPTNLARLIPQVSGMMYANDKKTVYVALYGGNQTAMQLGNGKVNLEQETKYPFGEDIFIRVNPKKEKQRFTIKLRIPTWLTKQFVPGKLYQYSEQPSGEFDLYVNNQVVNIQPENGFVDIDRVWKKGDKIHLKLPLTPRWNISDKRVEANHDRIALTCGPLVYCAEGVDNNGMVQRFIVNSSNKEFQFQDLSISDAKIKQILISGMELNKGEFEKGNLVMTPYFAWNNRGNGSMNVWLPTKRELAQDPHSSAYGGKFKHVKASFTNNSSQLDAIAEAFVPDSSGDKEIKHWSSYPQNGTEQWIEIDLLQRMSIQSISVYWYKEEGKIELPMSWKIKYQKNGEWEEFPLYVTDSYSVFEDQYNMVHPARKTKTSKIRIEMIPQKSSSVGVLDVIVEREPNTK